MNNYQTEEIEIMGATVEVAHYWEPGQPFGLEQEPIPAGIVIDYVEVIEDEPGDFSELGRQEQEDKAWEILTNRDDY